jgi:UDP-2-acetamido-2,6-beta-L-arabino-hexul-4-ose reductase
VRIAVTGATGFIGWHLLCALRAYDHDCIRIERRAWQAPEMLADALHGADAVIHAAGANRGPDNDVAGTNEFLAHTLVAALALTHDPPPFVIYLNSTHASRETPYGRSKRYAAEIISSASENAGGFSDVILPGVFGELGRPYYNSVVSTLCHQLSRGAELTVRDNEIELIHSQDVADQVVRIAAKRETGRHRILGTNTRVQQVADRLASFHNSYQSGTFPCIAHPFDRALFNTLRSYRFPHLYPTGLSPRLDERGSLLELVKAETSGQSFFSTTLPGVTRGNHFHRRKVERFVVVDGDATISVRRLFTSEVVQFRVSGATPTAIDIPSLHTHDITNVGSRPLMTVFWADEIFDPNFPDTTPEPV